MSSQAVEARSLSTITSLASNPPAYPRNPTHVRHDQLVLYIARVPGSRDVFLTPMKPRDKVVTAEDIQSSLYFVHVEQPEDEQLIVPPPEPEYGQHHPGFADRPPAPIVQRKAMPPSFVPASMPVAPKRKPVPGTLAPINNFDNRQNINAPNHSQQSTGMLGPDYISRRSEDSLRFQKENDRPRFPPRRPTEQDAAISLTLIRRDPASSAQWNVASIKDSPILEVSSLASRALDSKRRTGAPVYIDITNPGYSKFLNNSHGGVMPHLAGHHSNLPTGPYNPINVPQEAQVDDDESVFHRRLWLEGAKYSNSGFGHRKMNSNESDIARQSPRSSQEGWSRERSSADLRRPDASPFLARDDQAYSTIQVSERQSSFRGYVFMSPWNGRCEFITGTGGGSLKCRHVVPGLQGAAPMAMPVSELRFNLPSSSKASTPRGDETTKLSSFFHRPRHSRHNSSVGDYRSSDVDNSRSSLDRLDLSLGQEFAGGGYGGKQAKLGKLIIEDEGLKMVDLLVAANVALWWRAYEKASRGDRGSF